MDDKLKKDWEIYKRSAEHLCDEQDSRSCLSRDARYFISLRKNKLDSSGLTLKESIKFHDGIDTYSGVPFDSPQYFGRRLFLSYMRTIEYYHGSSRIFKLKDKQILYQTIINGKDSIDPYTTTYCCPSCGAVSTIAELEKGCPYCGSRFLMTELFPKVMDFFWLHDYGMTTAEYKKKLLLWCGIGATVGVVLSVTLNTAEDAVYRIISGIFGAVMCAGAGAFAGLLLMGVKTLFKLIKDAVKAVPILTSTSKTKKYITQLLKPYDPYFMYELFESRVIALMKIMLYSTDLSDCAVFCGDKYPVSDVIDAVYIGASAIENAERRGNYIWLTVVVYADCTHYSGGKIKVTRDRHRMRIFKNVSAVTDPGFSIHKVECDSCGASFDAARTKKCPYCGSEYHFYDHDWAVYSIEKI